MVKRPSDVSEYTDSLAGFAPDEEHGFAAQVVAAVTGGNNEGGEELRAPYRREIFQQHLEKYPTTEGWQTAVVTMLKDLGVNVYVIDSKGLETTADLMDPVRRALVRMAQENYAWAALPPRRARSAASAIDHQRCLLYQDPKGRLFNLVVGRYAVGPVEAFEDRLDGFSNAKATVALGLLLRMVPWALQADFYESLRPALIALIMGLVLLDELSMSLLNVTMLVRALPSLPAAQALLGTAVGRRDAPRHCVLFCLVLASLLASGRPSQVLTMIGLGGAIVVLFANLGARVWYSLWWPPLARGGPAAPVLTYGAAVATGFLLPFVAGRDVRVGGRAGIQHALVTALVALAGLLLTDIKLVQEAILGTEATQQQGLFDIVLGVWWVTTALASLVMTGSLPLRDAKPLGVEQFLEPHPAALAGYRVSSLPDYEIDPSRARTGCGACLSPRMQMMLGLLVVVMLGSGWVFWNHSLNEQMQGSLST